MGYGSCGGGLFGSSNDWIWIIIAIVIVLCLCGDGGLFGSQVSPYPNECC